MLGGRFPSPGRGDYFSGCAPDMDMDMNMDMELIKAQAINGL